MSRLRMALLAGIGVVVLALAAFGVALATVDLGRMRGLVAAQIERESGRAVRFGEETSLRLLPRPSLTLRDVTMANAAWAKGEDGGPAGPMLRLGLLQAQVELWPLVFSRALHITRLEARDGEIRLELDGEGRRNWDLGGSGGDASAPETVGDAGAEEAVPVGTDAAGLPQIGEVRLENVTLVWRDARRGGERRLAVSSLKLDTMEDGRFAVAAALSVDGEAVAVKGELDRPAGFLAPGGPFAATLDMTLPGTVAKLTGGLANAREGRGLDATLSVEAEPLRALQGIAGVALPAVKFQAAARLEGDLGGVVKAEGLRLVAGRSDLAGTAALHMDGARPRVVAVLESRRLDLVEAMPPGAAAPVSPAVSAPAATDAPEGAVARVFPDTPFGLPDLRVVDADVSLRVGEVVAPQVKLSDATLRLVLEDGDLAVRPFGFVLLGSHVAGDARWNAREAVPAVAVDVAAQKVELGAVLALLGQPKLVEAKGDLVVALRGRGGSARAVAETLEGTASLVVGQGVLAQDYVEALGLGALKAAVPQLQRVLDSKMNCAIARFEVKAGVATARLLVLDAGDLSIVGRGNVNLGAETIALDLPARLRIAGVPGLGGLVIPLQVRGTLAQPVVNAGRSARGNPLAALGGLVLDPGASRTNPCGGLVPGR
jgi:uncharacterized protein involved in outer membrane biogenesis